MTDRDFIDRVYRHATADETRALYDDWAASYDREIAANGYATPRRCAEALAGLMADPAAPVLDFGCGTGLSGLALRAAGIATIDGVDLSPQMLDGARAKGVYRRLRAIGAGAPLPAAPGDYAAVAAIGVIGRGSAPISVFDRLMAALAPGGLFVFSFNDHALSEPEFAAKPAQWTGTGRALERFCEYGPHLPGLDLKSNVYVLEKT